MTNYNDGNWHPWIAGQNSTCPVHPKSKLWLKFRDGQEIRLTNCLAGDLSWRETWGGTIVAFCVTEEYQEPREFWIFTNGHGDLAVTKTWHKDAIHVREVMPDD